MKKLQNTLYILGENRYLNLDGENVVIWQGKEQVGRKPLHTLESIISFSYEGASPALMGACAERGIALSFFNPNNGRFLARVQGKTNGNVLLRRMQYRMADDPWGSCRIARTFVFGKLYNCRTVLERAIREHSLRVDTSALKQVSGQLKDLYETAAESGSMEELRGLEGSGAKLYFSVFDQLILRNEDTFYMKERSRRPPLDAMNALLSFLYALLANNCTAALESVGLDSAVGFMHRDRPGRESLSLDLMEELRPVLADRLALTMVNRQEVTKSDFRFEAGGAVLLNDDGRKKVITAWHNRKKEELTHPYWKEKIPWGLVPFVQAQLLSRGIRGDLDGYPPFLWK